MLASSVWGSTKRSLTWSRRVSKLIYPRELYQRGVERKRVELIAAHFNEYVANEPKVSFRNGQFIVTDG